PHRVVLVHREGDPQFRPDAVNADDQHGLAHPRKVRAKQSAEATNFPEHLRAMRWPKEFANAALQLVCQIDIYARARISFSTCCHAEQRKGSLESLGRRWSGNLGVIIKKQDIPPFVPRLSRRHSRGATVHITHPSRSIPRLRSE